MKVCVITAKQWHPEQITGFVIAKTLEEAKVKARKKWHWYDSKDDLTLYYEGNPRTVVSWRTI